MKRWIALLMLVLLVLSGCSVGETQRPESAVSQENTSAAESEASQENLSSAESTPEATPTPLPEPTYLNERIAVGNAENVWLISAPELEAMTYPDLYLFGENLLAVGNVYTDQGMQTELKLISARSGALIASAAVPGGGMTTMQFGEDIVLCDPGSGRMTRFDADLQVIEQYECAPESTEWYCSADRKVLYIFDGQNGIFSCDLATGKRTQLFESCELYLRGKFEDDVYVFYMDMNTQCYVTRSFSLADGTFGDLPEGKGLLSVERAGDTWLMSDGLSMGEYLLAENGEIWEVEWRENRFKLLPEGYLLGMDGSGLVTTLYETNGEFVSRCELPAESSDYVGSNWVWSDLWEGYFFLNYFNGQPQLVFWDPAVESTGEALSVQLPEEPVWIGETAELELYERAREISETYGVEIYIADLCSLDYRTYDAYAAEDTAFLTDALDKLERALSAYPEGFFKLLSYGSVEHVAFDLVGGISVKPGYETVDARAFAYEDGNCYKVVASIYMAEESMYHHEISHIIDARMEWDARVRPDALFSEERWLELQPEGFTYAYDYVSDENGLPYEEFTQVDPDYFVDNYACTFPGEDRATMMEIIMMGNYGRFKEDGLKAKLEYYSACVEDCFGVKVF